MQLSPSPSIQSWCGHIARAGKLLRYGWIDAGCEHRLVTFLAVCSPRDAVRVFYGSGLDMLVMNGFVLHK